MTVLDKLISNTIWRSAADFISRLTSALFWILVARYLGANPLGSIAFALSMFSFFELISSLGLGSVLTRDVAKDRNAAATYFGHALVIGTISAILFTAIMALTVYFLRPNHDTAVNTWIMASALPLAGVFYFSRAMLIAIEKMLYVTLSSFIENVFQLTAGYLVLAGGYGAAQVVWVLVLGKVLACVIMIFFAVTKVARPRWRIEKAFIQYWLKQAPSFLLIAVLNGLFWSITIILLTKLGGEVEAGYYSAAFKLVSFFLMFALAYGQALFPVAARLSDDSVAPGMYVKLLRKSLKYIFICSLAVATVLSSLSRQIILFLYGAEMINAAPVLSYLAWLLVPYTAIPILAYTLVSHHLQRKDLLANFAGALILTLSLFILVPHWGAIGAAIAMLLGSIVFFSIEYLAVHWMLFSLRIRAGVLWPIGGVLAMSLWLFYTRAQHLLLGLILGAIFYALVLFLTRAVDVEEIRLLKKLFLRQL
ncbi:flippase [candidate division KSB1 bacterium]|nr:flippase [candidate division KSB1 bacterium]